MEEPRPPAPAASTLRLPPPTLPPRLGLILGGRPEPEPAPEPAPTAEYGRYLAVGCTGCHGDDMQMKIIEKIWMIPAK